MKLTAFLLFAALLSAPGSRAANSGDSSRHTYLALGDSYTIGTSVSTKERYAVQVLDMLKSDGFTFHEPEIIAANGWTTNDLLTALQDKKTNEPYDIVTLLIGVNNQYQEGSAENYRLEFTALLKKSIELAGNNPAHVIVISIPDYSVTPFASDLDGSSIAAEINAFNRINAEISAAFHTAYLPVTEESRKAKMNATLIARDGLHFSGEEYGVWASRLKTLIERAMSY